jgi:hypothetical protein
MFTQKYLGPRQWRYILNFETRTLTISTPQCVEDNYSLIFPFAHLVEDGKSYMKQAQIYLSGSPTRKEARILKSQQLNRIVEIKIRREQTPERVEKISQASTPPTETHQRAVISREQNPKLTHDITQATTPPTQARQCGTITLPTDELANMTCSEASGGILGGRTPEWERNRRQVKRIMGDDIYEVFLANLPASRPQ